MLGSIVLQPAASITATTTSFATIGTGTANALLIGFRVEAEEMLVDLEFQAVVSNDNGAGRVDLDFAVDGSRLGGTNGVLATPSISGVLAPVHMHRTVRLTKGDHTVAVQWKSAAGANTLECAAATRFPAHLYVRRSAHSQVLGQGVNSQVQTIL